VFIRSRPWCSRSRSSTRGPTNRQSTWQASPQPRLKNTLLISQDSYIRTINFTMQKDSVPKLCSFAAARGVRDPGAAPVARPTAGRHGDLVLQPRLHTRHTAAVSDLVPHTKEMLSLALLHQPRFHLRHATAVSLGEGATNAHRLTGNLYFSETLFCLPSREPGALPA
jgi:hypothetical protein